MEAEVWLQSPRRLPPLGLSLNFREKVCVVWGSQRCFGHGEPAGPVLIGGQHGEGLARARRLDGGGCPSHTRSGRKASDEGAFQARVGAGLTVHPTHIFFSQTVDLGTLKPWHVPLESFTPQSSPGC